MADARSVRLIGGKPMESSDLCFVPATDLAGARRGPLPGVPVSIKDLTITKGVRTTRGSKLYEHFVPEEDAPLVERLRAAGAISLGKKNSPEFGWKGGTDNRVFGPP